MASEPATPTKKGQSPTVYIAPGQFVIKQFGLDVLKIVPNSVEVRE